MIIVLSRLKTIFNISKQLLLNMGVLSADSTLDEDWNVFTRGMERYAEPGEFPSQVFLSYNGEFACGGSILSTLLILTAAHCVKHKQPDRLKITAGHHILSGDGQQVRTATYLYFNENNEDNSDENDIGLIRLSSPLEYTAHVQNISLPGKDEDFSGDVILTGLLRVNDMGNSVSPRLMKWNTTIIPNEECRRACTRRGPYATKENICTKNSIAHIGEAHGGSSLICRSQNGGSNVICGIRTASDGNRYTFSVGVFLRTSSYLEWIDKSIQELSKNCSELEHQCVVDGRCVPALYKCDNNPDCNDGSDEWNCTRDNVVIIALDTDLRSHPNVTELPCPKTEFFCSKDSRCINLPWRCDNERDCPSGEDEMGCDDSTGPVSCPDDYFRCSNSRCIPISFRCDQDEDCPSGEDEFECLKQNQLLTTTRIRLTSPVTTDGGVNMNLTRTTKAITSPCQDSQFYCSKDARCIPLRWRCDGDRDCTSGEDEHGCQKRQCTENQLYCSEDNRCIDLEMRCNGDQDCRSGEDKHECPKRQCTKNQFYYSSDNSCIDLKWRCDNETDCPAGEDEHECSSLEYTESQSDLGWKCNGNLDCPSGEDEEGRSKVNVTRCPSLLLWILFAWLFYNY